MAGVEWRVVSGGEVKETPFLRSRGKIILSEYPLPPQIFVESSNWHCKNLMYRLPSSVWKRS